MTQVTRFVDITRSYLPCNPNTFPDSMHEKTDMEERVPVMAYQGHNFLPTSYGYKSYFGINQNLGIDPIAARVDRIFTFQNDSLKNILIALCDSGIWYKYGGTAGAWVQVHATTPWVPGAQYYPWTFCIINDKLYAYRQNAAQYQLITSQVADPGFTLTNVTPTFLNMAGQLGIFRAGSRLGFWDSADSIAWSNMDDHADFVPSLETLAGSSVFSSIVGRIVTIECHGQGFIVYATKSFVFIREAAESLFQWEPTRILDGAGIAYSRQVTAGVPDTTHYAYSNIGLYEIKNAVPKIIVTQVTDYFKRDSAAPNYLKFLEGRYLFIQSMNADFINGNPQFTDEVVNDTIITFPGANLDLHDAVEDAKTQGSNGFCPVINGLGSGAFAQPEDEDPTKVWRPIYTAYLSGAQLIDPTVDWVTTPCAVTNIATGVPYAMSPSSPPSLSQATSDDSEKTVVSGADAYVDGNWTIERFIAAQTAIWKTQESQLASVFSQILGRTHVSQKVEESGSNINFNNESSCDLGRWVTKYSEPRFGFSKCEFWLTRFAIAFADLKVKRTAKCTSVLVPVQTVPRPILGWYIHTYLTCPGANVPGCTNSTVPYATPTAAYNACPTKCFTLVSDPWLLYSADEWGRPIQMSFPGTYGADAMVVRGACPAGWTISGLQSMSCTKAAHYVNTYQNTAYIDTANVMLPPIPDTGFCKLTGWKDIVSGEEIPADTCDAPDEVDLDDDLAAPISDEGSICGKPFEPFDIPGTPPVTINWPDQSVTIPGGSFLLQDGSGEPIYPTFEGAHVYDTHLSKWGKYLGRHKQLLDYAPINTFGPSEQSYSKFGIMGGILSEGGTLHLFDEFPEDSTITYGKFGYYRQGMTSMEEMRVHMASDCTGTITVETSVEGKNLSAGFSRTDNYVDSNLIIFYGGYTGKWHNMRLNGIFDITYLEYRGIRTGRR